MRSLLVGALCALGAAALAVAFIGGSVSAQAPQCDFETGGGWIVPSGAKATFGAAGGCNPSLFGHLVYNDQGTGLSVQWITITGYMVDDIPGFFPDPGARLICGTAKTNQFGNVDFVVRDKDGGEPGTNDEFDIRLTQNGVEKYSTFPSGPHKLDGARGGGGNTQLHARNSSTPPTSTCPAASTGQQFTLTVNIDPTSSGTGTVTDNFGKINCVAVEQGGTVIGTDTCSASYTSGTIVTLTAQGDSGAAGTFPNGAVECDAGQTFTQPQTCSVTMVANKSVTVKFIAPT